MFHTFRKIVVCLLTGSWGLLRSLGASWGALGGLLEPLGALFLGSWGLLGASWAVLEAIHNNAKITCKKRTTVRRQKKESTTFMGPHLGGQNTAKSDPKTRQNLTRCSRAKQLLSKSLLGPSWADLGEFLRPSWGSKMRSGIRRRSIS